MTWYALLYRWNDRSVPQINLGPKITREVLVQTALVIFRLHFECFREYVRSKPPLGRDLPPPRDEQSCMETQR